MKLSDLQKEFSEALIGERIYSRVNSLVEGMLRRRDPTIYARGAHDYRDALADVTQDFILDVLIGERQIDYVMSVSPDIESFDRLVTRQIRRYLARTRARTVIDNLIERSLPILRKAPFVTHAGGGEDRFSLGGALVDDPAGDEARLRTAVALAQAVPKTIGQGEERAPRIYDQEALTGVLSILCTQLKRPVFRADLQDFFHILLTPWATALLDLDAEEHARRTLTPEEEAVVNEVSQTMVAEMSDEERLIFQYKYANMPDREIASALGLSRQSTAPRKRELFLRISSQVEGLALDIQQAVLARVNAIIAIGGVDTG